MIHTMNEKDHAYWNTNKDRFENNEYIGCKLIGKDGVKLISSFKRLWLEHVYICTDGKCAVEFHQETQEFWGGIPKCGG
jgi:hypothetical protein